MVLPVHGEQHSQRGKAGLERKGCFTGMYMELSVLRSSSDAVGWCFPGTETSNVGWDPNPQPEHIAKATWTQPLPGVLLCGCK